jgi:hypothetical protein
MYYVLDWKGAGRWTLGCMLYAVGNPKNGSKVRRSDGSKVRRFDGSKVRRFEGTKVRRFEGSKVRRFDNGCRLQAVGNPMFLSAGGAENL